MPCRAFVIRLLLEGCRRYLLLVSLLGEMGKIGWRGTAQLRSETALKGLND